MFEICGGFRGQRGFSADCEHRGLREAADPLPPNPRCSKSAEDPGVGSYSADCEHRGLGGRRKLPGSNSRCSKSAEDPGGGSFSANGRMRCWPLESWSFARPSTFDPCTSNFALRPSPFALRPSPFALRPSPFTLHPSPFALRPSASRPLTRSPSDKPHATSPQPRAILSDRTAANRSYCERWLYTCAEIRNTRPGGAGQGITGTSMPSPARSASCNGSR